jgi:hypothetical protein
MNLEIFRAQIADPTFQVIPDPGGGLGPTPVFRI